MTLFIIKSKKLKRGTLTPKKTTTIKSFQKEDEHIFVVVWAFGNHSFLLILPSNS
jgi:hypothetical protein